MGQKLNVNKKLLLRTAERIRGCMHQAQSQTAEIQLPDHYWDECRALSQRVRLARSRGWHNAAAALAESLRYPLCQCLEQLNDLCNRWISGRPTESIAAVRDVFADLEALLDEFDDLSFDLSEAVLSVTTAPIVLEDILLGRFQEKAHERPLPDLEPAAQEAAAASAAAARESAEETSSTTASILPHGLGQASVLA
jgi:hypothetical protein